MQSARSLARFGVAGAAALTMVAMAIPAAGDPPSQPRGWCQADAQGRFDADRMPARFSREDCDVRGKVMFRRSVGLTVHPEVGYTAYAEAYGPHDTQELAVTTTDEGFQVDGLLPGTAPSGNPPTDCNDPTQGAGTAYKVGGSYPGYYVRDVGVPAAVGVTNTVNAIKNAIVGLVNHANDCREARDPNVLELPYNGLAGNVANFTSTGDCGTLDSVNVVDFGVVKGSYLALACHTRVNGRVVSYDLRMKSSAGWDHTLTDGCNNNNTAYDITSVMTHEWGHIYGLSHVVESSSPNLTMSESINGPCQTSERTLGRGDMDHMFAKYGVK